MLLPPLRSNPASTSWPRARVPASSLLAAASKEYMMNRNSKVVLLLRVSALSHYRTTAGETRLFSLHSRDRSIMFNRESCGRARVLRDSDRRMHAARRPNLSVDSEKEHQSRFGRGGTIVLPCACSNTAAAQYVPGRGSSNLRYTAALLSNPLIPPRLMSRRLLVFQRTTSMRCCQDRRNLWVFEDPSFL